MRNSVHRQFGEHSQGSTARRYGVEIQAVELDQATASPSPGTLCFSLQGSCSFPMFSLISMEQARRKFFKTRISTVEAPSIPHFLCAAHGFLDSWAACTLSTLSPKQQRILTLMFPDSTGTPHCLSHRVIFLLPRL